MSSNQSSTRQRLTNFSRRFSRRSNSYFPPQPEKPNEQTTNGDTNTATTGAPDPALNPQPNNLQVPYDSSATATASSEDPPSSSTDASPLSPQYQLRPPLHQGRFAALHASSKEFKLPDLPWLCGTWHVTHSTLPMWKKKRNVRISYTRLPGNKLDDLVTYQNMTSKQIQKVHGVDTPKRDGSYVWRGKGVLKVASSRWEVLGWGGGGRHAEATRFAGTQAVEMGAPNTVGANGSGETDDSEQWVVTYFAKTPFSPAGIDVYSRKSGGLSDATMHKLRKALARLDGRESQDAKPNSDLGILVDELFQVTSDGARNDIVEQR